MGPLSLGSRRLAGLPGSSALGPCTLTLLHPRLSLPGSCAPDSLREAPSAHGQGVQEAGGEASGGRLCAQGNPAPALPCCCPARRPHPGPPGAHRHGLAQAGRGLLPLDPQSHDTGTKLPIWDSLPVPWCPRSPGLAAVHPQPPASLTHPSHHPGCSWPRASQGALGPNIHALEET